MSKKDLPIKNGKCIRNGCAAWLHLKRYDPTAELAECERCGFDIEEDAMRKRIPLTLCKDGLRRKLIPPKPTHLTSETEEETEEDPDE